MPLIPSRLFPGRLMAVRLSGRRLAGASTIELPDVSDQAEGKFFVRWRDASTDAYTILALTPGPTDVEYPEQRLFTIQAPQDGGVVVQRPLRDARPRQWVWKGWTDALPQYRSLWAALRTLEYRTRLDAGKVPTVEVWEDVVPDAGFARKDGDGNKIWTPVKFLRVDRTPRKGGGPVRYEDSIIEFYLNDVSWQSH